MPRIFDEQPNKKGSKKKPGLLDVPVAEMLRRMNKGEELTASDKVKIELDNEKLNNALIDMQERFKQRIKSIAPWFDFSNKGYSYARLCGKLSRIYTGEPLSSWMDIPMDELMGYIDAACPEPKGDTDDEKERAIALWNANPKMIKKELELQILGSNVNHLTFFKSVKGYSDKRYGDKHLRKGESGSPRAKR